MDGYRSALSGLAVSFVRDFDAAHDLAQKAHVHAFLRLSRLEDAGRLPAWLQAITANRRRTWLRQGPERPGSESVDLEERMAAWHPPRKRRGAGDSGSPGRLTAGEEAEPTPQPLWSGRVRCQSRSVQALPRPLRRLPRSPSSTLAPRELCYQSASTPSPRPELSSLRLHPAAESCIFASGMGHSIGLLRRNSMSYKKLRGT